MKRLQFHKVGISQRHLSATSNLQQMKVLKKKDGAFLKSAQSKSRIKNFDLLTSPLQHWNGSDKAHEHACDDHQRHCQRKQEVACVAVEPQVSRFVLKHTFSRLKKISSAFQKIMPEPRTFRDLNPLTNSSAVGRTCAELQTARCVISAIIWADLHL